MTGDVTSNSYLSPDRIRRRIKMLEVEQKLMEIPEQIDPGVTHFMHGDTYIRSMFIPAGLLIVGRIHATDHICMIEGDIYVSDEFSDEHYQGFTMFHSPRGSKRIVRTERDSRFTTIHHIPGAGNMSIEEIEEMLSYTNYADYEDNLTLEVKE